VNGKTKDGLSPRETRRFFSQRESHYEKQKKEVTFLKKSNQKIFGPAGGDNAFATARRTKSFFASFFSKKEALAY
jgi:hypothetical protein